MDNNNIIVEDVDTDDYGSDSDEDENAEMTLQECLALLERVVHDYRRVLNFALHDIGVEEDNGVLRDRVIRGTQIALVATLNRITRRFDIVL